LWLRRIEKAEDSPAIRTNSVVDDPAFLLITGLFVVRFVVFGLVERVGDAFVEDLFGVLGSRGPLRAWNRA